MDVTLHIVEQKREQKENTLILIKFAFIDETLWEKVHYILQISLRSASNLAPRGALERSPIEEFISSQSFTYLVRFNNPNINPLLKEAFY